MTLIFHRNQHLLHLLAFGCLIFTAIFQAAPVHAQSDTGTWATPVNLSQSGSATNPTLLIDSDSVVHAVWQDKYLGFFHSEKTAEGWTAPAVLPSPWIPADALTKPGKTVLDTPVPFFIADHKGMIYAFWIDGFNQLWTTHALASTFGAVGSWSSSSMLADSVLNVAVTIDANNQLHLAYIYQNQTDYKQSGIYYLRTLADEVSWSKETLLVADGYFRSMTKDQANLSITAGSTDSGTTVFVAWDNRLLKKVSLARSEDGGETWDQPNQVAGPESNAGDALPYNIRVGAAGKNAVLVWQVGQPDKSCTQYTEGSSDGGSTWTSPQTMLTTVSGCAQDNQFIGNANNQIFLASTVLNQVYLLYWNGDQWSEPQLQQALYSFVNPDTYSAVNLQCFQFVFANSTQLYAAGCDVSDVGDVWLTSRTIGSTASWFQPKPNWDLPVVVTNATQPVTGQILIPDGEGTVHSLWIQPDPDRLGTKSIFYSRWDGENWSTPTSLQNQPDGDVTDLSATLDDHDRLLITWSSGLSGQMYFAWADASKAINVAEWTSPQLLTIQQAGGSNPKILADSYGKVDIVYAVPFNEGRGIYLISSSDQGQTWSQPVTVFDAVAANWGHVDLPEIYQQPDGRLGILWSQLTLLGDEQSALYSSVSNDGGQTWSPASKIIDSDPLWRQIVAGNGNNVSLAWLEKSDQVYTMRAIQSNDGGMTWGRPEIIFNSAKILNTVELFPDASNELHLFFVTQENNTDMTLAHWIWDGKSWSAADTLPLDVSTSQVNGLAAAISAKGHLYIAYDNQTLNSTDGSITNVLQFADQVLTLAPDTQTAVPTLVPAATPTTITSTDLVPSFTGVTPSLVPVDPSRSSGGGPLSSTWGGIALSVVFAVLVIAAGIAYNKFGHRNQ